VVGVVVAVAVAVVVAVGVGVAVVVGVAVGVVVGVAVAVVVGVAVVVAVGVAVVVAVGVVVGVAVVVVVGVVAMSGKPNNLRKLLGACDAVLVAYQRRDGNATIAVKPVSAITETAPGVHKGEPPYLSGFTYRLRRLRAPARPGEPSEALYLEDRPR
jgi:hypothetical protein